MAQDSPNQKMVEPCDDTKTWVEVRLIDEQDAPVVGAAYKVVLPDGSVMTGTTDDNGAARFESIVPGNCQVSFPEIHGKEWNPA